MRKKLIKNVFKRILILESKINQFKQLVSQGKMSQDILDGNKRIKIEALIDTGNGPEQLSPSIYSKVISASVGSGETKQVLLNVEDYGDLDVSSAVNFRWSWVI